MAVVLYDGLASSMKAVDVALVPQLVSQRSTKDDQIIFLHGWDDAISTAAPMTQPQLQQQASALHVVLSSLMEQIEKNKHAKDTLNYKIEMMRLSHTLLPVPAAAAARVPTPATQPPPPPAAGSKPGTASKSSAAPAAAAVPVTPQSAGDIPGTAAVDGAASSMTPSLVLGSFVRERSRHHNLDAVVLGVGNETNGKSHTIGRLAKELYDMQYSVSSLIPVDNTSSSDPADADAAYAAPWTLWYVKPTGSTIRPASSVKYLVLVDGDSTTSRPLSALQFVLGTLCSASRHDRVFVLVVTSGISSTTTPRLENGDHQPSRVEGIVAEAKSVLAAAGQTEDGTTAGDESGAAAGGGDEGGAAAGSAPPAQVVPLVSTYRLEATKEFQKPTLNDVPQQLIKAIGKFKVDFLVLPPKSQTTLSTATVHQLLGTLKPHVVVPTSLHV